MPLENEPSAERCDDCTEAPCACEPAAKWLTETIRTGRGDVTFYTNENGDIALTWWDALGVRRFAVGDTVEDTVLAAQQKERNLLHAPEP